MTAIRKHAKEALAVLGLIAVAAGVSLYLLDQQRMRFPWEESPLRLKAEFATAQAVTAGQGQTVRVSGVRVGDIGEVELVDGKAVVEMVIDPEYEGMIRQDASALLRPKTGLKDMFIDLEPGSDDAPAADEGYTVPIKSTSPDVNPDEILAELDADTRDYLTLLIGDAGRGLEGRGLDLREILRRFEPTHRDLARVNSRGRQAAQEPPAPDPLAQHAQRRAGLARRRPRRAGRLLGRRDAPVRRRAGERVGRRRRASGGAEDDHGHDEQPPAVRHPARPDRREAAPGGARAGPANEAIRPLAREATPLLRDDIRPFVREARPVVRDLRPAAKNLAKATPALTRSFEHLNRFLNLATLNPNGREDPDNAARQEGYLFWVAWAQHMATQLFSSSDAHGTFRPVTVGAPCATIEQLVKEEPELEFLSMLTPILTDSQACGTG